MCQVLSKVKVITYIWCVMCQILSYVKVIAHVWYVMCQVLSQVNVNVHVYTKRSQVLYKVNVITHIWYVMCQVYPRSGSFSRLQVLPMLEREWVLSWTRSTVDFITGQFLKLESVLDLTCDVLLGVDLFPNFSVTRGFYIHVYIVNKTQLKLDGEIRPAHVTYHITYQVDLTNVPTTIHR